MGNNRLIFADFTKLFAMFIVTWGHCAQCLSGQTFPTLLGSKGLFIAFHMPLFMIINGFFLDGKRVANHKCWDYIKNKFHRLVIPAVMWYFLYSFLTLHLPQLKSVFTFYWFLSSMFLSYILILFICKISLNKYFLIIAIIIVAALPFSFILNVNFMLPMIVCGGGLHYYLIKYQSSSLFLVIMGILSLIVLYAWDVKYSVYITPFDSLKFSLTMLVAFCMRLLTGGIVSTFLILLFMRIQTLQPIKKLASYGKYTLVMYTVSFIINGIMRRFLNIFDFSISQPVVLDLISFIWTICVCLLSIRCAIVMKKYALAKKYLLGLSTKNV